MTDTPHTRLSGKEFSPLVIRRYSTPFLHWVALISDDNLDELDFVTREFWKANSVGETIQALRNNAGALSAAIVERFTHTEGCAVIFSADKMLISSLYGDFMNHEQCRLELYSLLAVSTQI